MFKKIPVFKQNQPNLGVLDLLIQPQFVVLIDRFEYEGPIAGTKKNGSMIVVQQMASPLASPLSKEDMAAWLREGT